MFRLVLATIFVMCFAPNSFVDAQSTNAWVKVDAAMRLPAFYIEEQGIEAFFSDFSLTNDIPIGLEIASNNDQFAIYRVDFYGGPQTRQHIASNCAALLKQ